MVRLDSFKVISQGGFISGLDDAHACRRWRRFFLRGTLLLLDCTAKVTTCGVAFADCRKDEAEGSGCGLEGI